MFAYATLVTNEDYGLGALALARSLRRAGSSHPLLVLTPEGAGEGAGHLDRLESEGCRIVPVGRPAVSAAFLERHGRRRLHEAAPFTKGGKPFFHDPLDNFRKLELWRLTDHARIVFIDADALVLRNVDRLFGYPEFAAAPNLYESLEDFGRMNSGVFVAEPSLATYEAMIARLDVPGAFWPRTDQTFLAACFPDWHGLPYLDNTLQYVFFNLPDLWRWRDIRILHYQYEKPWEPDHPKAHLLKPLIDLWWTVHDGGAPPEALPTPFARPRS
jgi:alpha-N-acetylglucosamine transferase